MSEIFFDAITNIREDLVEEAQEFVFRKRYTLRWRYMGMAACLAVVLLFGVYSHIRMGASGGAGSDNAAPSAGSGQTGNSGGASQSTEAVSGDQPEYGYNNADGAGGNDSGGGEPAPGMHFQAVVLEVRMDTLLVEVLSDGGMEQIEIPTGGLGDLPEFRAGDVVTVYCAGFSAEDGTAVGVEAIVLAEPDSP